MPFDEDEIKILDKVAERIKGRIDSLEEFLKDRFKGRGWDWRVGLRSRRWLRLKML